MSDVCCGGKRCGQTHDPAPDSAGGSGVTRRTFMQSLGLTAAVGAVGSRVEQAMARRADPATGKVVGPGSTNIALRINGKASTLAVEPHTTLLEALRERMKLTGSKVVCDRGSCGACSVLLNGALVVSCMTLAMDAEGAEVTTIEGLAPDAKLDPVQEAFIRHDALQCGFCTPGLVMASRALLNDNPKPSLAEIKKGLSGNICRCGTYTNVFNAVLDASGQPTIRDGEGA